MKRLLVAIACLCSISDSATAQDLPWAQLSFCCGRPITRSFRDGVESVSMVFVGTVERRNDDTATVRIESILKNHVALAGRKSIDVFDGNSSKLGAKYLIWANVARTRIESEGEIGEPTDALLKYLKTSVAFDPKDRAKRYRFYFDHLEDADRLIAGDALTELAKLKGAELKDVAATLPADKIAARIDDPKFGGASLYAVLLGHCGDKRHLDVLRGRIRRSEDGKQSPLIDGVLIGCFRLSPTIGTEEIRAVLKTRGRGDELFARRYSAYTAVSYLHKWHSDQFDRKTYLEILGMLLDDPNLADFAVDDLRRAKAWDTSGRVLDLDDNKEFSSKGVKRAILRYALRCPGDRARLFVENRRRMDPEFVEDVEALLDLEAERAK